MPASNPLEILIEHDRWATRNVIAACVLLTHEQFHQRFDIGPGSLHNTTTHILSALRGWGDLLAGRAEQPRFDGVERTPAELLALHDELATDFGTTARKHSLEETVSRERGGKMYSFTRGGVITHVATHGMHHRAQCLNMLRGVGVNPLPHSSVLEWMLMADSNR
jgi:uncharacterized damage-inducible protein DinB